MLGYICEVCLGQVQDTVLLKNLCIKRHSYVSAVITVSVSIKQNIYFEEKKAAQLLIGCLISFTRETSPSKPNQKIFFQTKCLKKFKMHVL